MKTFEDVLTDFDTIHERDMTNAHLGNRLRDLSADSVTESPMSHGNPDRPHRHQTKYMLSALN